MSQNSNYSEDDNMEERQASSDGLSSDDSNSHDSNNEEMFTSSDSEKSEKSHVSINSSDDEKNKQKLENTETPEFLEASYMQIDISKESKNFSTMHCVSEINSNISTITNAPLMMSSDEKREFHMIKYRCYLEEAQELKKMVPKIQLDHLETKEFILPSNSDDDKISTMLELRTKRRIIIYKANEYYKKAFKHLIMREKEQDMSNLGTIMDRARVNREKANLYMYIALNFMDLACLDEETEGRGQYIIKYLSYAQKSLDQASNLEAEEARIIQLQLSSQSIRVQEQFEFKIWDKISRFEEYEMTQKLLERAYRSIPKVEDRPFYMIKLRHYLAKKLFEIYYQIAVMVENKEQDTEQALLLMNESLKLCNEFNSLEHETFRLNERPVIAKIKSLQDKYQVEQKHKDYEVARAKYNEALQYKSMIRKEDPPSSEYLSRPSTKDLIKKTIKVFGEVLEQTRLRPVFEEDNLSQEQKYGLFEQQQQQQTQDHLPSMINIELSSIYNMGLLLFKYLNDICNCRFFLANFVILFNFCSPPMPLEYDSCLGILGYIEQLLQKAPIKEATRLRAIEIKVRRERMEMMEWVKWMVREQNDKWVVKQIQSRVAKWEQNTNEEEERKEMFKQSNQEKIESAQEQIVEIDCGDQNTFLEEPQKPQPEFDQEEQIVEPEKIPSDLGHLLLLLFHPLKCQPIQSMDSLYLNQFISDLVKKSMQ